MLVFYHTYSTSLCTYTDIDECAEGTDECDEHCYNTVGSYSCDCTSAGPGYQLHSDGTTCESKPPQPCARPYSQPFNVMLIEKLGIGLGVRLSQLAASSPDWLITKDMKNHCRYQ